jgi:hypothetical protein
LKKAKENTSHIHSIGVVEINVMCSKDVENPREKPLKAWTLKDLCRVAHRMGKKKNQ